MVRTRSQGDMIPQLRCHARQKPAESHAKSGVTYPFALVKKTIRTIQDAGFRSYPCWLRTSLGTLAPDGRRGGRNVEGLGQGRRGSPGLRPRSPLGPIGHARLLPACRGAGEGGRPGWRQSGSRAGKGTAPAESRRGSPFRISTCRVSGRGQRVRGRGHPGTPCCWDRLGTRHKRSGRGSRHASACPGGPWA